MKRKRKVLTAGILCLGLSINTVAFANPNVSEPEITQNKAVGATFADNNITYRVLSDNTVAVISNSEDPSTSPSTYSGEITIPKEVTNEGKTYSVTEIGNIAFERSSVTKVVLPETITTINLQAFAYCESLTEVVLNNGLTTIGNSAFFHCDNLATLTLPSSLQTIGSSAFSGCQKLESLTIPAGVKSGLKAALTNYPHTDALTFEDGSPYSVITGVLYNGLTMEGWIDTNVTDIVVPDGVKEIPSQAFGGPVATNPSITSIVLPDSVERIGQNAFQNSDISSVNLSGVKQIDTLAFGNCSNLTEVIWPTNLASLGEKCFQGCESITEINISGDIKTIPKNAFQGCLSVEQISLPDGLEEIEQYAFALGTRKSGGVYENDDPKLESINIPETVKEVGKVFLAGIQSEGKTAVIFEGNEPPTFETDAFKQISGENNKPTVYYPADAKDAYTDASNALVTSGLVTAPTAGEESDQAVSLTVSPASDSILEGEQATFTVTHTPKAADIVVTNSNDNVATVALADGVLTVTGKNAGSTTVTLSLQINGYEVATKSVTVSVSEPPYTGKYSYEVFTSVGAGGTLSVDRYATEGDKVTIEVTPDEAYLLDALVVTANGKEVELTDNGDGTYTFTMPSADVKISATFAEDPDWTEPEEPATDVSDIFIDVAPNAWYKDAVQYAYAGGLMTGVSANEFAPDATTTRGMIVSMLARLEGVESANDAGFADVEGEWYATAVNWAASVGVVNGYEDNTFRPNDAITREQLAAILMNYAAYKGEDVSNRADLTSYTDQPSAWAEETMSWAVAEGLISGVTNTELQPQGQATRAQVAAILQRFLDN